MTPEQQAICKAIDRAIDQRKADQSVVRAAEINYEDQEHIAKLEQWQFMEALFDGFAQIVPTQNGVRVVVPLGAVWK